MFSIFCLVSDVAKANITIVYPKKNLVTINAKSTFFIGSANPKQKLYINSKEVEVKENGAFAQLVELGKEGQNDFVLKSGNEELKFSIMKQTATNNYIKEPKLIEFCTMEFRVNTTTALRATPFDSGINRLAELPQDTKVLINGEKGNFARVYLYKDTYGWVQKKDLIQSKANNLENIELKKFETKCNNDNIQYEFTLTDKAPFSIYEDSDGLALTLYNLKTESETFMLKHPAKKLLGYDYYYKHNKFILKTRYNKDENKISPVVIIDPGHGGTEYGAIGCCGVTEKDINLAISKLVEQNLKDKGIKTLLTRKNDATLSLNDRTKFAKDNDAQILVSIHSNALPDGQDPLLNRGTSVYYYHPQAKLLAQNILDEVTSQAKTNDDRVRQRSLALVRPTSSVSVLVEVGYMINPDDYTMLTDKCFQQACAKAIADGIIKYLEN